MNSQRVMTAIIAFVMFAVMMLVFIGMWATLGGSLPYRHG